LGKTLIDWGSQDPVVLGGEVKNFPDAVTGCVLFQSSGSSGKKKWVAIHRESLEWSARRVIEYLSMGREDVCGLALPTHHVGGFGLVARSHFSGARLARYEEKWNAKGFASWMAEERVTVSSLVPTQVVDLVSGFIEAPASVRSVIVGGGAFSESLALRAQELGWPVLASYGMTETSSQVATGNVGGGIPLLPGWEAKLKGERLALKGGGLLEGYLEDGEFYDPKVDGWFLTSDRVVLEGGGLRVLGRADRQVKILGELVDLDVLEEEWRVFLERDVALVALPDQRRGVTLWLAVTGGDQGIQERNESLPGLEKLKNWKVRFSLNSPAARSAK